MGIAEILLLGLALSMDAFAVTISNSFVYQHESRARMMLMPVFFGVFQGLMPLLGYFLGTLAADLIERFAGIVTLVILGFIGGNMIFEGVKAIRGAGAGEGEEPSQNGSAAKRLTIVTVFLQAIATSIDAFAVGVSLLAAGASIAVASPVIALTTFACCVIALLVGKRFGNLLGDRAQVVGGVVLVCIGIKALF